MHKFLNFDKKGPRGGCGMVIVFLSLYYICVV